MPATISDINAALNSPEFSESDKWVIKWQYGLLTGEFECLLAELIKSADLGNLARLETVFPVEVRGYRDWAHCGLGKKIREWGLDI